MDATNAIFELIGALLIIINIRKVLEDGEVKGVSPIPVTFFTLWGFWNIFYYPYLGQWLSFIAGIIMFITNTIWVGLMLYYIREEQRNIVDEVEREMERPLEEAPRIRRPLFRAPENNRPHLTNQEMVERTGLLHEQVTIPEPLPDFDVDDLWEGEEEEDEW